jgi:hypothetical protein
MVIMRLDWVRYSFYYFSLHKSVGMEPKEPRSQMKENLRIKSSSQLLPMKLLSQRAIYPKLMQFFKDWHPALLRGLWAAMRLDEDTCIDRVVGYIMLSIQAA